MIVYESDPLRRPLVTLPFTKEGLLEHEPCGMYGCQKSKHKKSIMCSSCAAEMRDDPEAFK
jgi:hypothetical protein